MSKQDPPKAGLRRQADDVTIFKAHLSYEKARTQRKQQQANIYRPGIAPDWLYENTATQSTAPSVVHAEAAVEPRGYIEQNNEHQDEFVAEIVSAAPHDQHHQHHTDNYTSNTDVAVEEVEFVFDPSTLCVEEEEGEEEEEDSRDVRRRAQLKQQLLQEAAVADEEERDDDEEPVSRQVDDRHTHTLSLSHTHAQSTSDDSDDDDDDEDDFKPVFRSKQQRKTIEERELMEQLEAEEERLLALRKVERKQESKQILIEQLTREEEVEAMAAASNVDVLPDDADNSEDELEELQAWKIRELRRLKRDKEERDFAKKAVEEHLKRQSNYKNQITDFDKNKSIGKAASQRDNNESISSFSYAKSRY